MNLDKLHNVYLIGVGGIGMSAIARYFNSLGKSVAGYDKTQTDLTKELEKEGINIHFEDKLELIEKQYFVKENTLIVYTPAVPNNHKELEYFISNNFNVVKRAEVLGIISKNKNTIAVSGTHGKTSISTIITYLLDSSKQACSAFLGGISKNFDSNLVLNINSENIILEADEFDRSFLKLYPDIAVVSSVDADHLDIYGDKNELVRTFEQFVSQIKEGGKLLIKQGLDIMVDKRIKKYTYSVNSTADFNAKNIRFNNEIQSFDLETPFGEISNLNLGIPGIINVENSVVSIAVALLSGVSKEEITETLPNFKGVKRRFDYIINTEKLIFIDDYAHHPEELRATISSVRKLYHGRKITGIFQPHLFSRTNDFYKEFAKSLDLLDEIILMDIYPAREKPINGVTSKLIFDEINNRNKVLCTRKNLIEIISEKQIDVLLTLGAGDIDNKVIEIKNILINK
jgi:UDP-N-acetylmuramate--alanine ligase